jgi:hypothetical protein
MVIGSVAAVYEADIVVEAVKALYHFDLPGAYLL